MDNRLTVAMRLVERHAGAWGRPRGGAIRRALDNLSQAWWALGVRSEEGEAITRDDRIALHLMFDRVAAAVDGRSTPVRRRGIAAPALGLRWAQYGLFGRRPGAGEPDVSGAVHALVVLSATRPAASAPTDGVGPTAGAGGAAGHARGPGWAGGAKSTQLGDMHGIDGGPATDAPARDFDGRFARIWLRQRRLVRAAKKLLKLL